MIRVFAVVYETGTQEMRRLIDTTEDKDDGHLELIKKFLAADETMEVFRQADFPIKFPRFVAPFIGQGATVDKADISKPIDVTKIADISVSAKAFADQQLAKEKELPPFVPKIDPNEAGGP